MTTITAEEFWTGGKSLEDNETSSAKPVPESVKDISYPIQSAKTIFLQYSLFAAIYKFAGSLLLLLASVVLKRETVYWAVAFLVVLPFSLSYLSHLLTVLFEYAHTGFQHGRNTK